MKKILSLSLCVLLAFQTVLVDLSLAEKLDQYVVAVLDFRNTSGRENLNYMQESIPESMATYLGKSGKIELAERGRLKEVIGEMELGMTGIIAEETAAKVGKAVGATAVIVGSYTAVGKKVRINARMIEVASGKVITAEQMEGKTGEEMLALIDQISDALLYKLTGERLIKKKRGKGIWVLLGVGVVAVGGAGAALALGGKKEEPPPSPPPLTELPGFPDPPK